MMNTGGSHRVNEVLFTPNLSVATPCVLKLFKKSLFQWISVRETNCIIHWIEIIYPVDSAI